MPVAILSSLKSMIFTMRDSEKDEREGVEQVSEAVQRRGRSVVNVQRIVENGVLGAELWRARL